MNKIDHLKTDKFESVTEVSSPTIFVAENYAEDWYKDALAEVNDSANKNNKRREIVFAACFLETYLYEWVRNHGTNFLEKYFVKDIGGKYFAGSLKDKWKYIPPDLAKKLVVTKDLKLDLSGLGTLINLRNGFIHAKASKLYNSSTKKKDQPCPTQEKLENIKSGWAVAVAEKLVISLNEKMNSNAPSYLRRW